ncbi:unnamed protein product [Rotaria socialis]
MILIHQIKAPKDKGLDKRSKDLWTLNDSNEDGSRDEIEPKSVETRQDEHDVKGRNDEENGKTAVDGMPDIGTSLKRDEIMKDIYLNHLRIVIKRTLSNLVNYIEPGRHILGTEFTNDQLPLAVNDITNEVVFIGCTRTNENRKYLLFIYMNGYKFNFHEYAAKHSVIPFTLTILLSKFVTRKTIEMQTTRSSVISVPSASSKLPVKRSRTM